MILASGLIAIASLAIKWSDAMDASSAMTMLMGREDAGIRYV